MINLTWYKVGYDKGYLEGARDFAEFITRLEYPNAIDEVVETRVNSLIKKYMESCNEKSKRIHG